MSLKTRFIAAAMLFLPSVATAATVDLTVGGDWTKFRFDAGYLGGAWLDGQSDPSQGPLEAVKFNLNVTDFALLQVTDAWWYGDEFSVSLNGDLLGHTSEVDPIDPATLSTAMITYYNTYGDFDTAFADDLASSGEWLLGAGDYTITGFLTAAPTTRGSGAVRAVELVPTPLPGALFLLLGGGAGLAAMAKRKKAALKG